MEPGKVKPEQEWSPEQRDSFFGQHEPPGSYGLCWKRVTKEGLSFHCTKLPEHEGECGKGKG